MRIWLLHPLTRRLLALRFLALLLLAAAAWLPSYFFQQRTGFYRRNAGACDIGLQDGVVWATGNPVPIATGQRTAQGLLIRRYGIRGLFTREGVPVPLAWLCGLFLPVVLAGASLVLWLVKPKDIPPSP